jgi:multiple sugar transport system substrate-binding protein
VNGVDVTHSYSRREFLGVTGGVAAAGLLAARGSNTGRASGDTIEQW